jgi:sarcosine oxidase
VTGGPEAVVVGAGVFGAAAARELAGRGWRVILVEQHTPGDVRATSGGETRLIRYGHGEDTWYTRSAWRARTLWEELEAEAGTELLVRCGVVWLAHREGGWEAASLATLAAEQIPAERLDPDELRALFPDLHVDDLAFGVLEPSAGALHARRATQALAASAVRRGATLVRGRAAPGSGGAVVAQPDGSARELRADAVVWACGPWLAGLFPGLVELRVTQQDVLFFGAPADAGWASPPAPAWIDYDGAVYGIGDVDGRGLKVAPDAEGPPFDPDTGARVALPAHAEAARAALAHRFPALADAPLVGSRTCQYELTPDTHFVVAPHPERASHWIVGGGSGHGFKHGPALAEHVADLVEGRSAPIPRLGLGPRGAGRALRTAGS